MKNNNSKTNKDSQFSNIRRTVLENLNMNPDWISILNKNPIPHIIKEGKPGEVFLLLKNVYGLDHKHALFRLVESAVFKQQAIHRISNKKYIPQENEFNDELAFYFQLQKIHQLVDLGATDYLNPIKSEIIKLMSFQDQNGRFPMNYHHHAHACNLLFALGLEGNKLIDKAIHFLLSRQRKDGGWIHRHNIPKSAKYDSAKSCIWTTAEIAMLLSKRKIFKNSDYLFKANLFLINNYLNTNKSTLLSKSDSWECLSINHRSEHMFAGGTLKILEIFLNSKELDLKITKKMINWMIDQQMDNGLFPKIANKYPVQDMLVTNRFLLVVKKYFQIIQV